MQTSNKLVDVEYSYDGVIGTPMVVYGVTREWVTDFVNRMNNAGHCAHIIGDDDYASITPSEGLRESLM